MPRTLPSLFIILLFFLSGFCNLVYEVVWTRMFNLVFGVTVFAVSAVLAALMLGMAAGGVVFGRLADTGRNNCIAFSFVHLGIAVSTVLLLSAFPLFNPLYLAVNNALGQNIPLFRIVIFLLAVVLMIVPTTLMGATFPLAVKMLAVHKDRLARDIGTLYSINTFGSVIGCIMAVFVMLGPLGMRGTVFFAAAADLVIGCAALAVFRAFGKGNQAA